MTTPVHAKNSCHFQKER